MRQFIEDATGLSIYPVISFLIFLVFTACVLLWMWAQPKKYYLSMKAMPLLDEPSADANTPSSNA